MHNRVGTLFGLEQTNLVNCNFFAQAKIFCKNTKQPLCLFLFNTAIKLMHFLFTPTTHRLLTHKIFIDIIRREQECNFHIHVILQHVTSSSHHQKENPCLLVWFISTNAFLTTLYTVHLYTVSFIKKLQLDGWNTKWLDLSVLLYILGKLPISKLGQRLDKTLKLRKVDWSIDSTLS